MYDATAVVNVHREGLLLQSTMNSLVACRNIARQSGFSIEFVVIADNVDAETKNIIEKFAPHIDVIEYVNFRDLGRSRQFGISIAAAEWVFLHDGDDLFSRNWYIDFLNHARSGLASKNTVYHTNLFLGFQRDHFFRLMLDSDDPLFDPMFLISEWYYSNKCVAHAELFAKFPFPHNDLKRGLGNEDWTWSCHTLRSGIKHTYVPNTICFYRLKPPEDSLGLAPGVIHNYSDLFDPDFVRGETRKRWELPFSITPFSMHHARKGWDPSVELELSDWVWDEINYQSYFEPLLTNIYDLPNEKCKFRIPNINTNVSQAWRHFCEYVDAREKIIITMTEKNTTSADYAIEIVLAAAKKLDNESYQPILIIDENNLNFDQEYLYAKYGAAVLNVRKLRHTRGFEEWYLYRFICRIYIQFKSKCVIDFGSDVFRSVFSEFYKPICSLHSNIRLVYLETELDIASVAYGNVMACARVFEDQRLERSSIYALSQSFCELLQHAGFDSFLLDTFTISMWRQLRKHRFSLNYKTRVDIAAQVDFEALFDDMTHPALPKESAHKKAPDRSALARPITDNLSSAHSVSRTNHAWFTRDISAKATDLFRDRTDVAILIPQIIVWRRVDGRFGSVWLDNSEIDRALRSLLDLMIIEKITLPFFAFYRDPGMIGNSSLSLRPKEQVVSNAVAFIGNTIEMSQKCKCIALQNSMCIGTEYQSLPPELIMAP